MNESPISQPPHLLISNTLSHWQPVDLQFLGSFAFSQSISLSFFLYPISNLWLVIWNVLSPTPSSRCKQALLLHLSHKTLVKMKIHCLLLPPGSWGIKLYNLADCCHQNQWPPTSINQVHCAISQYFYFFYGAFLNIFFVSDSCHWSQRNKSMYLPGWWLSLGLVPSSIS